MRSSPLASLKKYLPNIGYSVLYAQVKSLDSYSLKIGLYMFSSCKRSQADIIEMLILLSLGKHRRILRRVTKGS